MIPVGEYMVDPAAIFAIRRTKFGVLQVFLIYDVAEGNAVACEQGQEAAVLAAVGETGRIAA